MQDMQASDQGASDGNASGNSLPLAQSAWSRSTSTWLHGPVNIGRAVRIKRLHASTEFCNDAISQAPHAPAAGARSPPDEGRRRIQPGCMRCDEWGCGKTYDPTVNNGFQNLSAQHVGLLPAPACTLLCQRLPRLQTLTKRGQQTWRARI